MADYGLIGYWKLDETSGTSVADSAGSYTGTNSNATISTSVPNSPYLASNVRCLDFNGSTSYVDLGSITIPSTVSFAAWVYLPTLPSAYKFFLSNDDVPGNAGISIGIDPSNKIYGAIGNGYRNVNAAVSAATWYHICVTGNTASGTPKIYLNGVDQTSGSNSATSGFTNGSNLYIGRRPGGAYVAARIDDVRLYNRILTAADAAQLATGYLSNGLYIHYKMNEPSGTTATDYSGNSLSGTYTNGPAVSTDKPNALPDRTGCYNFDGSNDYLISSATGSTITNKTVMAWVKLGSTSQTGGGLVGLQNSGGTVFDSIVYNETSQGWGFGSDSRTAWSNVSETRTDEWVHLAATYSANDYKLYRNGVQILSTASFGITSFASTSAFIVGIRHVGGSSPYLNAKIADARLYDRALTASEITTIARANLNTGILGIINF